MSENEQPQVQVGVGAEQAERSPQDQRCDQQHVLEDRVLADHWHGGNHHVGIQAREAESEEESSADVRDRPTVENRALTRNAAKHENQNTAPSTNSLIMP